ncbi:MAG: hypothetical protein ACEQSB_01085 [Undibacterium sp.]
MEKKPQYYIAKIRQAMAVWHHRSRHMLDEFQERFAASRPILPETPLAPSGPKSEPSPVRSMLTEYWGKHPEWRTSLFLSGLFLLGVIGGYTLKSFAADSFTIGHDDYRLVSSDRLYALNVLRERALAGGATLTAPTKPNYPTCSEDVDISVNESEL